VSDVLQLRRLLFAAILFAAMSSATPLGGGGQPCLGSQGHCSFCVEAYIVTGKYPLNLSPADRVKHAQWLHFL